MSFILLPLLDKIEREDKLWIQTSGYPLKGA